MGDPRLEIEAPQIRLADRSALAPYVEVLEEAGQWLWERDIPQWEPGSQRRMRPLFERWLQRGSLLIAERGSGIVGGCIVTATAAPIWDDLPAPAAYLFKLAVARSHAGTGLGHRLLRHAEAWGRTEGYAILRLDCWAGNDVLRRYYGDAGFEERGVVPEGPYDVRRFERRLAS